MDFPSKETYSMEDLLEIIRILRAPGGCPWDREQTHQSIRVCFLEETYEAVEAIDTSNMELLQEELGDVLLQVLLHAQMEAERGVFSFSDVVDGIARKLILRHPHVFGKTEVSSTEEVLENWDAIKKRTKHHETQTQVLRSISPALPALMRSAKVQKKAEKAAMLPADAGRAMEEVEERLAQLRQTKEKNLDCRDALGDLLFAVVNTARVLKLEPEHALTLSCDRFIAAFEEREQRIQEQNVES